VSVGLWVGERAWPIGTGDFVFAFFSTIRVRLEPGGWGTRFPTLMRELYAGELAAAAAPRALAELERIREELRALPPAAVVWDAEDRSKRPPWGDRIAAEITDLGSYFVTSEGRDLLEVLAEALDCAAHAGAALRIAPY
jgi:2,3-bisphosphoglycerate-dependent phosphoglycerate mutase